MGGDAAFTMPVSYRLLEIRAGLAAVLLASVIVAALPAWAEVTLPPVSGTAARTVIPWGDIVFLDARRLLVPYAVEEPVDDELRRRARADFERWRRLPVGEAVEALLATNKGGDARLARPLAEVFIRYLQQHPEAVRRQLAAERWVRELGLRLMRIAQGRLKEVRRIPLWIGWQRVDDRAETVPGGLTRVVRSGGLRVGVRVRSNGIVAWVPEHLAGAAASFLDPASLEVRAVEPGFTPLAWLAEKRLLGWRRNERGTPMVGVYVRAAQGEFYALGGLAPGSGLLQVRPLYEGAPPLAALIPPGPRRGAHARLQPHSSKNSPNFALLCTGARLSMLDLQSGRITAVLTGDIPLGCPLADPPLSWAVVDRPGGPRLLALERRGGTLREVRVIRPPLPGLWSGPVAARSGSIFLLRDPGTTTPTIQGGGGAVSRTTSRRAELWRFNTDLGRWRRLTPPIVALDSAKLLEGARLAAVSPDGRWLALRRDAKEVTLVVPASPS